MKKHLLSEERLYMILNSMYYKSFYILKIRKSDFIFTNQLITMHEIRKNRLYNEENPISKEELDILCFEDDFWRVYDILYDNSELEDIVEYSSKVDFLSIWESILENPKNKSFFKKLYEESWIIIASDRELITLWVITQYHNYNWLDY